MTKWLISPYTIYNRSCLFLVRCGPGGGSGQEGLVGCVLLAKLLLNDLAMRTRIDNAIGSRTNRPVVNTGIF